jgi:FMN-dependent NADH-azoreductase
MKTLIINAHPDPHSTTSATNQMVHHLLKKLPAGSAEVVNLAEIDIQPVDKALLDAFATVFNQQQPDAAQVAVLSRINATVAQLKSTTRLVIALPLYNFGIPARLKDWLDNIVVPNQTFRYTENGYPEGLMNTHKALILQASGGIFSTGDYAKMEFTVPYLQTLLGNFLGFKSVDVVRAEGTAQIGVDAAIQKALPELDKKINGFLAE